MLLRFGPYSIRCLKDANSQKTFFPVNSMNVACFLGLAAAFMHTAERWRTTECGSSVYGSFLFSWGKSAPFASRNLSDQCILVCSPYKNSQKGGTYKENCFCGCDTLIPKVILKITKQCFVNSDHPSYFFFFHISSLYDSYLLVKNTAEKYVTSCRNSWGEHVTRSCTEIYLQVRKHI